MTMNTETLKALREQYSYPQTTCKICGHEMQRFYNPGLPDATGYRHGWRSWECPVHPEIIEPENNQADGDVIDLVNDYEALVNRIKEINKGVLQDIRRRYVHIPYHPAANWNNTPQMGDTTVVALVDLVMALKMEVA